MQTETMGTMSSLEKFSLSSINDKLYKQYYTKGNDTPPNYYGHSLWFYMKDWSNNGDDKNLFSVVCDNGAGTGTTIDMLTVDFAPTTNNLHIKVKTSATLLGGAPNFSNSECVIKNIPIQKWVFLTVCVSGKILDVYMDGKLIKTLIMLDVTNYPTSATIDSFDVIFSNNNSVWNGIISKYTHYPKELNPKFVWDQYSKGWGGSTSISSTYELALDLKKNGESIQSIGF
jgi:hypothetical protein